MDAVSLGIIKRLHGFKGAFVVDSSTGEESALQYLKKVYVEGAAYTIEEAAWMPKGWKVQLVEVTTEAAAKALLGKTLQANRQDLEETGSNEFYVHDLIGAMAKDVDTEKDVGTFLRAESVKGGQDLWWFDGEGHEFSVPATKDFIVKVETKTKTIWIHLPK